jgi:hypothetical protein
MTSLGTKWCHRWLNDVTGDKLNFTDDKMMSLAKECIIWRRIHVTSDEIMWLANNWRHWRWNNDWCQNDITGGKIVKKCVILMTNLCHWQWNNVTGDEIRGLTTKWRHWGQNDVTVTKWYHWWQNDDTGKNGLFSDDIVTVDEITLWAMKWCDWWQNDITGGKIVKKWVILAKNLRHWRWNNATGEEKTGSTTKWRHWRRADVTASPTTD